MPGYLNSFSNVVLTTLTYIPYKKDCKNAVKPSPYASLAHVNHHILLVININFTSTVERFPIYHMESSQTFKKRFHHSNTSAASNSIHFLSLAIRYTALDKTNTLSKELSTRTILLLISTAHKTLLTTGSVLM